jgi:ABC-type uncharacterized transport system ATPase subunit
LYATPLLFQKNPASPAILTGMRQELWLIQQNILSVKGITKSFPGVTALEDVDFSLLKGEIHALMGENGAGKSTLIKVITGVEHPDQGTD